MLRRSAFGVKGRLTKGGHGNNGNELRYTTWTGTGWLLNDKVTARLFKSMIALAAVFGAMEARLAWVQLGGGGKSENAIAGLSEQAYLQHSDPLALDNGRGRFLDRDGRPLTGRTIRALAAFPTGGMPRGTADRLQALAKTLGTSVNQVDAWLGAIREPRVWKEEHTGGCRGADRGAGEANPRARTDRHCRSALFRP
ncbi:hypothetical protein [Cohnella rhizosphaerae]|uniref:Uncharacterized protein n=1 Tax=Cohnella rhizosphaerae TaxID=1457232 RepID=A0A9X4L1Y8_9BACL|nr:hypothetical protein [Cohnella rhizosphaerae]MDG0812047.1 hypothetical protein [Cohnella rhizosphaerae]